MNAKRLEQDRNALVELSKAMTPKERLIAFFNHSRLIGQLYRAGESFRKRSSPAKTKKSSISKR